MTSGIPSPIVSQIERRAPGNLRLMIVDDEPDKLWQSYKAASALDGVEVIPVLHDVREADAGEYGPVRTIPDRMDDQRRARGDYLEPKEMAAIHAFGAAGVKPLIALSSAEVIAFARSMNADAVLTDYNMPWLKGDELAVDCISAGLLTAIHTMGGPQQEMLHKNLLSSLNVRVLLKEPELNMPEIVQGFQDQIEAVRGR